MTIHKQGHIDPVADQKAISKAIQRELTDIGLDLHRVATDYLSEKRIDNFGDLAKSITHMIQELVAGWRLEFGANAKHAIYVHEGTKPHWPPKAAIRSWAYKKLGLRGKELDTRTFFIRRNISRFGTKSKPFLAVAIRVHQQKIQGRI